MRLKIAVFHGLTRSLFGLLAAGALIGATEASAALILDESSSRYLGSVTKSTPSNPANEVNYINEMTGLALNGSTIFNGNTIERSGNSFSDLPTATTTGSYKNNAGTPFVINLDDFETGWTYLYAKYGSGNDNVGALVWVVTGLTGEVQIPSQKLSHWSLYNPGDKTVPDGGLTALLLGLALSGMGATRRFLKK